MKLQTMKEKIKKFAKGKRATTCEETLEILYNALKTLNVPYRISKKKEIVVNVAGHPRVIAKIGDDIGHPYLKEFVKFI